MPIAEAYNGGTALPIILAILAILFPLNSYVNGKDCKAAPSLIDKALSSSGWTNLPLEMLKNFVVIVGDGLFHHNRPKVSLKESFFPIKHFSCNSLSSAKPNLSPPSFLIF